MTGDGRQLRPTVFLDRDGTINVEKDYLYRVEDFEFIPGAPEAIRTLKNAGYLVIVVTNQSGIARGLYTAADVDRLHRHIDAELDEYGTAVDAYYYCPHHPDAGIGELKVACACRKPAPGMLLRAAREHDVMLNASFMVGDKMADIEAAVAAGCTPVLVRTGYGENVGDRLDHDVIVADDIVAAVDRILSR